MKSFKKYITEVLDRPLKWKEFTKQPTAREASFDVGEYGYNIRVLIPKNAPNMMKTIGVEFTLGSEGGVSKGQGQKHDILKTGNAGVVFATVIDYIKHVVKDEKAERILFSGKEQSRRSLYNAILKRMMKMGIIKRFENNGDSFDAYVEKVK
tara:strand:+ start:99 stop:554 length:456 start_codon:yes stop_codon:yes gene_type:complete